jgi:hypothetical protein
LVLAFLLVLSKIAHANIHAPMNMTSKSKTDQKQQTSSTQNNAKDAFINYTPTGHSSDKIKQ